MPKFLFLFIVAFVAYLLWPRNPDITKFDPAKVASPDIKGWIAVKSGGELDALKQFYGEYNAGFGFSPLAALMIARCQIEAIKKMQYAADVADGERFVLPALLEKYAIISRDSQRPFDFDAVARAELSWMALLRDGAPADKIAPVMAHALALYFGGAKSHYLSAAAELAEALVLVEGRSNPGEGEDTAGAAECAAIEGFRRLKEAVSVAAAEVGTER